MASLSISDDNEDDVDEEARVVKVAGSHSFHEYVGKRVAKKFGVPDDDGDITYRGLVKELVDFEGEPCFYIRYDDGDNKHVGLDKLRGVLYITFFQLI